MTISFFNYSGRYESLPQLLPELITRHCSDGQFILKESVLSFERSLSQYLKKRGNNTDDVYCTAVSSASYGMIIALKALNIGPGDEVITPAWSYISTASSIASVGATPVFVDVDPNTFMLSPPLVATRVTKHTKAVIAVHLYSHMVNIAELRAALPENVSIVEDSATCLGGRAHNKAAGLMGDIGVYSFFPAKPLGGLGDGGAIITHNKQLYRICKMYRNHGQDGQVRFTHFLLGYNSRMDDINAAFLEMKLPLLDSNNERRRAIADKYDKAIDGIGWKRQSEAFTSGNIEEVPYSYVFLATNPKTLINYLREKSIEAKPGFPLALTSQPAFSPWVDSKNVYINANDIAEHAVALPLYPEMTNLEVFEVIEALKAFSRSEND
ncbi:DegT/DnrJ/EryC1/StrS family aminotransferase [Brenneria tiliae]|uniref:DegT/DnrJ/EryC1/StrS family aminotransferase n=1 Tax=Brenneria tiliae TaxID=2914984 RepID=UPI002014DAE9|nr:DegT/DnrJ/EryC1/StrS family aminotransferase [Brenneria tiliae]MCL2897119.1 DegT/DnrJ/EryC1/StrS family aminotransferase [Brenneria tiliae]MCL2904772.1 DegT/DnrJ/EryC1/StrS family aminotransferase [Brenneria tiliae]